jgi:hypothetical protein
MKKIIFVFLALGLLVSCSSTKVVDTWKDPSTTLSRQNIKKILFIALVKDEQTRRIVEDKLVSLSKGKGVASYTFLKDANLDKSEKANLTGQLKVDGFDLIVIMHLQDVKTETNYVAGSSAAPMNGYYGMSGYGGYWGGYNYAAPMYYNSGFYTTDKKYIVGTDVYTVQPDKLVWSGVTSSFNPSDVKTATREIAEAVIKEMEKDGFLVK